VFNDMALGLNGRRGWFAPMTTLRRP